MFAVGGQESFWLIFPYAAILSAVGIAAAFFLPGKTKQAETVVVE